MSKGEEMDKKKLTKRSEDFSQWYQDVIDNADLAEHSPVRGCMVIKPYGYSIWEKIVQILDEMLKKIGVQNAYFPLFIPESFLKKEAEHVEGFSPELAIVTHGGGKKLEENLVVRPTSETIIYDSFSKWIQSYRDLPLIINQWANVVRWEMRPRLFLRTTEFLWQEGHTAHATPEESEKYALMILRDVYQKLAEDYLAMPVYLGEKSESERFAGAKKTFCMEALMQDGKSLQSGTAHDLSDNFSKSFAVKFLDDDGKSKYVFQSSWGVSTRLIGGLIMSHSDDKGLVLPPRIAPIQVIVIPISNGEDEVFERAKKIATDLESICSVKLDSRFHLTPGEKYYEWEKKGVPLRVEFGPKDFEKGQCVVVRRDTGNKEFVPLNLLGKRVAELLEKIQENLFQAATVRRERMNFKADTWSDFTKAIDNGGYVFAHWCNTPECEKNIKEKVKVVTRCLPFNGEIEIGEQRCVHCGKNAGNKRWIFAKAY